jgi:hypothetical protein
MYIKSSRVSSYLPETMEEYQLPLWLMTEDSDRPVDWRDKLQDELDEGDKDNVSVEIYSDEGILGREGLLDMFNLKRQPLADKHFWSLKLPKDTTYKDIRTDLASRMNVDSIEKLRLFVMGYGSVGQYHSAQWRNVPLSNRVGDSTGSADAI